MNYKKDRYLHKLRSFGRDDDYKALSGLRAHCSPGRVEVADAGPGTTGRPVAMATVDAGR